MLGIVSKNNFIEKYGKRLQNVSKYGQIFGIHSSEGKYFLKFQMPKMSKKIPIIIKFNISCFAKLKNFVICKLNLSICKRKHAPPYQIDYLHIFWSIIFLK